ncbi:DUF547 domain-containing protein [Vibrio diazotrophicus]|uniref:DUF547 domain-containing protein n=1 Tax=Vibrio diazotrophicus TaxID=685 RepID=UPI00142E1855|nr:DUF547 domain-containing protein [Vibrio diazotrophicus]NIY93954.1 DUF547 domain-containing protein [Vibrio diazotrophicus]
MKRLLAFALLLFSPLSFSAPKSDLWSYWDVSNQQSSTSLSHHKWQAILDIYLISQGEYTLFKYAQVTPSDKEKLTEYLSELSKTDPRELNKKEQYAYWVNFYNALTVQLILDNYPIASITKVGSWFGFGPWDDEIANVAGKPLTLNDIEHRILRPIWGDPRTHYAINCASLGCPNLQPKAFTAENTELLLEKAAREFINSDKGVSYQDDHLTLSSIYDWFAEDFGNRPQLFEHLSKYRTGVSHYQGDIKYEYDWKLNEKK